MGVERPEQASKAFEAMFRDGDLDGLMGLYEAEAVFTNASGAFVGLPAIREVLQAYLDTGATITMNESVAFEAGELALVHWSWTMNFTDGRVAEGATAEVLRRQDDGSWRFVIDNPDGPALINHN
jgi:ketosteroid isomerase-like protein